LMMRAAIGPKAALRIVPNATMLRFRHPWLRQGLSY
jgi:hypothetical protein